MPESCDARQLAVNYRIIRLAKPPESSTNLSVHKERRPNDSSLASILLIGVAVAVLLTTAGCGRAGNGQSNANESPVPDGRIVLLKRKNEVAAFILKHQRISPEQADFYWYYRSDGKGTFPSGNPAVSSGYVSNATQVSFSTFAVQWSINTGGMGWVYFSVGPTELGKSADYLMCVTTETNLAAIDANDHVWKYRARPHVNVKALIDSEIKK